MKKLITLIAALVLVLALPACTQTAGDRANDVKNDAPHPTENVLLSEKALPSEEPPKTSPTLEPQPAPSEKAPTASTSTAEQAKKTPQPTTAATQKPTAQKSEFISRDQAIDIALKNAALARSEVFDLEAELDKERSVTYWEVDFETRQHEYSYDINAQTGAIVRQEKERND